MTLNGLRKEHAQFWTPIGVCETFHAFPQLSALLLSEEQMNGGSTIGISQEDAFYSNSSRGRGRGR